MVEVKEKNCQENLGPSNITIENVQYWSKHTKELKSTQRKKALQFVEYDCIRYIGRDEEFGSNYCFVCLPLNKATEVSVPVKSSFYLDKDEDFQIDTGENSITLSKKPFDVDYNFSVYKIYKNADGRFECNCQGWQTYEKFVEAGVKEAKPDGCQCSHVLGLFYSFKLKKFKRGDIEE